MKQTRMLFHKIGEHRIPLNNIVEWGSRTVEVKKSSGETFIGDNSDHVQHFEVFYREIGWGPTENRVFTYVLESDDPLKLQQMKDFITILDAINYMNDEEKYKTDLLLRASEVIDILAIYQHQLMKEEGWWDNPREDGTLLMLMTSEISECMEAIRKDFGNSDKTGMPLALEELADTVIRILDFCGSKDWPLGKAIVRKMEYNRTRKNWSSSNKF